MIGDTGGVPSGVLGFLHPPRLLGQIADGGLHGKLLRIIVSSFGGGDSELTAVPHHLKCDVVCSGDPLGITGGGRRGVSGRVR